MKKILFILLVLIPLKNFAQVENLIVETYYVSDANDATDTTGGGLTEGSTTYRIYVDLKAGCKLRKIYGDVNHVLKFKSTAPFFNNKADGQSFAKDFSKTRLGENTVALDSWLTLGQATRVAAKTYFGVLKMDDTNGSFIGGSHNDGGSAVIPNGLLNNSDNRAGIPLTNADGLDTMVNVPGSWADYGIVDFISGTDSTIFGSIIQCSEFISHDCGLQNSGVSGVDTTNIVLIAQLTTLGELSFEINLEVEEFNGVGSNIVKYVANADTLLSDELLSPFLKYPAMCGCKDPEFLEFSPAYSCSNNDSCRTRIVFGCMDVLACNYDVNANYSIPELCCYPGFCNDRDISQVCPQLSVERNRVHEFEIYPNPAGKEITVQGYSNDQSELKYILFDMYGRIVMETTTGVISGSFKFQIDTEELAKGIYSLRLNYDGANNDKILIKN